MNRRQFIRDSALAGGASVSRRPQYAADGRQGPEINDSLISGSGAALRLLHLHRLQGIPAWHGDLHLAEYQPAVLGGVQFAVVCPAADREHDIGVSRRGGPRIGLLLQDLLRRLVALPDRFCG